MIGVQLQHSARSGRRISSSVRQGRRSVSRLACGKLDLNGAERRDVLLRGRFQKLRNLKEFVFVQLADRTGTAQVFIDAPDVVEAVRATPLHSTVEVRGSLVARPPTDQRPDVRSGGVEVVGSGWEVVGRVQRPLPYLPASAPGARQQSEETRLRHRHIDLRGAMMQRNLFVRAEALRAARDALHAAEFLEVETPVLFKSSPEGAAEFLVPSRRRGAFFALPQSPQQLKQILISGGVDRYFQIARCFRDEAGRADRQPEFTQIDLEAAFARPADVIAVVERAVSALWAGGADALRRAHTADPARDNGVAGPPAPDATALPPPRSLDRALRFRDVPRLSYADAMARFGSDKPDLRWRQEIVEVTELVAGCQEPFLRTLLSVPGAVACALRVPEAWSAMSRAEVDEMLASVGLTPREVGLWRLRGDGVISSRLAEDMGEPLARAVVDAAGGKAGDFLAFCAGQPADVLDRLGRIRAATARDPRLLAAAAVSGLFVDTPQPLWVVDFPLFEDDGAGGLKSAHHPFTAPLPEDLPLLRQALSATGSERQRLALRVRAAAFDLVLNGVELGGGSVRIHDAALQRDVLSRLLKVSAAEMEGFEPLLRALEHGAPPHAGFALGVDRTLALLVGADSVRDVIAFPKSATGQDLMAGSPAQVSDEQLAAYHIALRPPTAGGTPAVDEVERGDGHPAE